MDKQVSSRSTKEKALRLNLDEKKYGTIVEIGADGTLELQGNETVGALFAIASTARVVLNQFTLTLGGVGSATSVSMEGVISGRALSAGRLVLAEAFKVAS